MAEPTPALTYTTVVVYNGSSDYTTINDGSALSGVLVDGIISFITGASAFSADQTLLSISNSGSNIVYGQVGIDANGHLFLETYDGSTQNRITGSAFLDTETEYVIGFTGTGSLHRLRIVGRQSDEYITETTGTNDGDWYADMSGIDNVTLGALKLTGGITDYFEGTISEVCLYNENLTSLLGPKIRRHLARRYPSSVAPLIVLTQDTTLIASGATEIKVGGPAHFHTYLNPGYDYTQVDTDVVDNAVATYGSGTTPYIADLEVFEVDQVSTQVDTLLETASTHAWTMAQLQLVADRWATASRPWGWYGILPSHIGHYYSYIQYLNDPENETYLANYLNWQGCNCDNTHDLVTKADLLCPSIFALGAAAYYQWTDYADGQIAEAYRIGRGRPIYPFMWAYYHPSGDDEAIALATWEYMVQYVAADPRVDGIIAWTQTGCDPDPDWRDVLVEEMGSRTEEAPPPP